MRCLLLCACTAALLLLAPAALADESVQATVDVPALVRVALTQEADGKSKAAGATYAQIIAADPDHRLARRALGYVKLDGRWMTKAAAKKAVAVVRETPAPKTSAAKESTPRVVARKEHRTIEALDDTTRARRAGRRLYSLHQRTRNAAAEELGKIGSLLAAHYLVSRWELVSGQAPLGYFSSVSQQSYIQDFDTEVA